MNPDTAFVVDGYRIDQRRGTAAMWLFIVSEALLFGMLFFAYFYLWHEAASGWVVVPPKLTLAFCMLAVLLSSSMLVDEAEKLAARGRAAAARAWISAACLLGVVFLGLQAAEYHERLKEVSPQKDAYGSTFFAITSLHGLHVVLGMLMLGYVLMLPEIGRTARPPHRSLHNAALYWHFVDALWVLIVAILYVAPNWPDWGRM